MEHLLVNVAGKIRRDKLFNREHLVVPVTMIVPGVLNGSRGPLLYSPEEVAKDPTSWNQIPVVVNHPKTTDGLPASAKDPDVLNTQGVGVLFASTINSSGNLIAEAWFDIEQTHKIDSSIISNLEDNKPIELSTGLALEAEPVENTEEAVFNGVAYTHFAKNFVPDHLAILPTEVGACSIKDGCGVGVVNKDTENILPMSQEDLRTNLLSELKKKHGTDGSLWIEDVFPSFVVYFFEEKLLKVSYKKTKGKITIGIIPAIEVYKVTQYKSIENKEKEMDSEKRTAIVNQLIEGCCWKEKDREVLNSASDETLEALEADATKQEEQTAVVNAAKAGFTDPGGNVFTLNEETKEFEMTKKTEDLKKSDELKKPTTMNEWMETAPAEVQSIVKNAMQHEQNQKNKLVEKITVNLEGDQKTKATNTAKEMSLEALEIWASTIPEKLAANYQGSASAGFASNSGGEELEVLPLPGLQEVDA